jgi:hypothetical protein
MRLGWLTLLKVSEKSFSPHSSVGPSYPRTLMVSFSPEQTVFMKLSSESVGQIKQKTWGNSFSMRANEDVQAPSMHTAVKRSGPYFLMTSMIKSATYLASLVSPDVSVALMK